MRLQLTSDIENGDTSVFDVLSVVERSCYAYESPTTPIPHYRFPLKTYAERLQHTHGHLLNPLATSVTRFQVWHAALTLRVPELVLVQQLP